MLVAHEFCSSNYQKESGAKMREGWHGEDYLILFDESELTAASNRYEMARLLPVS
jgi:hypothetical protein